MDEGRAGYQRRRLALLSSNIQLSESRGLEVGASDLPTVPKTVGSCRYADFRTAKEMVELWNLPAETVCHVDYLLTRNRGILEQIPDRFDYIVACHVLEHVPDVITYINDLKSLLDQGPGKAILLTLPDKRATLDGTRPSTTIERLLAYHYNQIKYPLFDHVLEFHRHWAGYGNGGGPLPIAEAYEFTERNWKSGEADAHCHVWEDKEFLSQSRELIEGGFLPGLRIAHFEPNFEGTNEFAIVFKTV